MFPRVADAAVDLDALLGEQPLAVTGRGLGDRCCGRAPRIVLGDREGREVAGRARPLQRDHHVGELVLDRLERSDRHAELLALLHVLERDVEDRLGGADDLERQRHRRCFDGPAEPGRDATRCRARPARGHDRRARRRGARAQGGGCRRRQGPAVVWVAATGTTTAHTPSSPCVPSTRATTTSSSTASPSITNRFSPVEHGAVRARTRPSLSHSGGVVRAAVLGNCQRALDLAGGNAAEEPGTLFGRSRLPYRRYELGHGRQQCARSDDRARALRRGCPLRSCRARCRRPPRAR